MPRSLADITGLETLKTLVGALSVPDFTIDELAGQTGVGRRTVDTVRRRYEYAFERIPGTGQAARGRPPVRWRLRSDHLEEVVAAVDALQSALGTSERAQLAEPPEPEVTETSLIMAAAAIAHRTGDAGEAEQFVAAARRSLSAAGFGADGSPRAGDADERQLSKARLVAAVTDLVDASTAGDQFRIDSARSRALPRVISASRSMSIAEWLPLAQRAMLAPGAGPGLEGVAGGSKTDVLLAYAEDAVVRSYEVGDAAQRRDLVEIVTNFLYAADPFSAAATAGPVSPLPWWNSDAWQYHPQALPAAGPPVPLDEMIRQRAQRVAAFASIGACLADGLPIDGTGLRAAAETVVAGYDSLPAGELWRWVRLLVRASIAEDNQPPPVGVLTRPDRSPHELFPLTRGEWQCIGVPLDLTTARYTLWVEDWAEPLCAHGLISGIVMSHEDTPESNEVLGELLASAERNRGIARFGAVIVASTADDPGVVRKVSRDGGIFYPIRDTREGLVQAVSSAVTQAVGVTSERYEIARFVKSAYRHVVGMLHRHRGKWEINVSPGTPPPLEPSWLAGGEDSHWEDIAAQRRQAPLSQGDFQVVQATPLSPAHLSVRLGANRAGITIALRHSPGSQAEHLLETAVLDENGVGTLHLQGRPDSPLEIVLIEAPR